MADLDLRAELETAITAEYAKEGQAPTPPVAASEPAAATEVTPPAEPAETPAPATPEAPAPLTLTDKSIVTDPATGEQKTWGEIKAERLRFADYTRKTQSLAEERRAAEAARLQFQAEQAALAAKAATAHLPELPDDDPYAQRIRAVEAQTQAYLAAQAAQNQALESERFAVANAKLEADVKRVAGEFKLNEQEMDIVGREVLAKMQRGEQATLEDAAKQFVGYRESLRAAAVREFKEKHRVGAPAANVAVPATGLPEEGPPPPHTRARSEYLRNLLVGAR